MFAGIEDCRTVRVIDAQECVIKIYPHPLPDLVPEEAACLLDEVQTKTVHLRKTRPRNLVLTDRINVAGKGAVTELVRYDENGAAVWHSKNIDSFALKGEPDRTRQVIRQLTLEHCAGQSRMISGGSSGGNMSVQDAFRKADDGSLVLVDIRLPSEWQRSGVGVNAHAITMHQPISHFVDTLKKIAGPEKRPIALICAEGVRSAMMQNRLKEYGFQGVINVHEGMDGSSKGPGWIKSGLPVTAYRPE